MKKRKPLTDNEGEVRELMSADPKNFRATEEILSPSLVQKLSVRGRAEQEPTTKSELRYGCLGTSLKGFAQLEKGWQTRLDAALRDWLQRHSPN